MPGTDLVPYRVPRWFAPWPEHILFIHGAALRSAARAVEDAAAEMRMTICDETATHHVIRNRDLCCGTYDTGGACREHCRCTI